VNTFDLIIFDCDGVLVDSEVLACQSLAETLGRHGIPSSLADVYSRFLGRSFTVVEEHYQRARGEPLPDAFRTGLRETQASLFQSSLKAIPHIRDVLGSLKVPFCLASSSDAERIRVTLAATGLDALFGDRVYTAAMVARGKPAPDLFLLAARSMGALPARTLVVEDSLTGVEAGKAAGMTVWGFIGGSHYAGRRDIEAALVAAGADRVFASMAEFATTETLAE
jgi:HAD superfamily hydrolase (TIGR01509 family)